MLILVIYNEPFLADSLEGLLRQQRQALTIIYRDGNILSPEIAQQDSYFCTEGQVLQCCKARADNLCISDHISM